MKAPARNLWIGMVGLTLALSLGSCGGGGGDGKTMTCDQACAKIATECAKETLADCLTGCQESQPIMADTYWNQMGDCITATECATLDTETCYQNVVAGAPSTASDQLLSRLCDKMITCVTGVTKDQCIANVKSSAGTSLAGLNVLKTSVIDCLGTCMTALDCATLMDENSDSMGTCSAQCGLPTG
jgi:hypothetical protein